MRESDNALELRNVSKSYPDFQLRQVSFFLPKGSIMGFIGENGAGKTTTIKSILNLVRPDEGEIQILGYDSVKEERAAKMDVGVVFDDLFLQPTFQAKDLATIFRSVYSNWDPSAFEGYLNRFSLPEKKKVKDYSRGMRMKLSLAAALCHHPKLLLLDEATSGLDPVMRNEILDILQEFIEDGEHSVLLSSHITSDLERVADYVTFLHKGSVIFSDSKDTLLESYGVLKCGREDFSRLPQRQIVGRRESHFGVEALVRGRSEFLRLYPNLLVEPASLEEIMVFYNTEKNILDTAKEDMA